MQDIEGFVRYLQLVFLHDPLISKWIGSLSNYDIRTSLEITKDLISSPHLSVDDFLKAYVSTNSVTSNDESSIKPFRIKNAIIKRNYYSYPVNHHPYVQNLFYCAGNVNTSPLLGLRVLQVLSDRKSDRSADDAFLSILQIQDYFSAMGIDRPVVYKHLQFLLSKGLIRSYDPSVTDIDFSKALELTPSGAEHYYWAISDKDYAYTMLEVTPITDKIFFQKILDNYYVYRQRLELTIEFLDYLEGEDSLYCKIPDHVAYEGQKTVSIRFDWQRKIIKRYLERQN